MDQVRMDVHPNGHAAEADAAAQSGQASTGWWPLDCLRSLGRAASIASGQAGQSLKQHADYRGFRILTAGQDGCYGARVTHWQGEAIRLGRTLKHTIDNARFCSHEEAAQHARFVIASGALNQFGSSATSGANTARA
ncbi:MAG: hypothetical protein ABI608_09030, partial [Rhizomicrobium sp.]